MLVENPSASLLLCSSTLRLKDLRLPPVPADMTNEDLLLLKLLLSPGGLSDPLLSDLANCLGLVNLEREREEEEEERERKEREREREEVYGRKRRVERYRQRKETSRNIKSPKLIFVHVHVHVHTCTVHVCTLVST